MSDRLAQATLVVGSLLVAFAWMGWFWFAWEFSGFDTGRKDDGFVIWLNASVLVSLFYGVLLVLTLRGHRLAAGFLAAIAWLVAVGTWWWLAYLAGDLGVVWQAVVFLALVATVSAIAATYLTIRGKSAAASGSAPRAAGPSWPTAPGRTGSGEGPKSAPQDRNRPDATR